LALFQILTPVFTVLFNAAALHVSPSFVLGWILNRPGLEVFESLALMPIAGLAILRMRRWSYLVFCLAMLWSIAANLRHWQYASSNYSALSIATVYLFQLGLAVYFLLPAVRRTYFDPTVRWWESKPRYELKVPARLGEHDGTILNVSEGGVFVETRDRLPMGQKLTLQFDILGQSFGIVAAVVHERESREGGGALHYGLRFEHTQETERRFRNLTRGLQLLGFQDRSKRLPGFQSFREWFSTLLKTGRGLTPEARGRGGR
jgi:hypothetical protein